MFHWHDAGWYVLPVLDSWETFHVWAHFLLLTLDCYLGLPSMSHQSAKFVKGHRKAQSLGSKWVSDFKFKCTVVRIERKVCSLGLCCQVQGLRFLKITWTHPFFFFLSFFLSFFPFFFVFVFVLLKCSGSSWSCWFILWLVKVCFKFSVNLPLLCVCSLLLWHVCLSIRGLLFILGFYDFSFDICVQLACYVFS